MIAIVSSISRLLCAAHGALQVRHRPSNPYATAQPETGRFGRIRLLLCLVAVALLGSARVTAAQPTKTTQGVNRTTAVGGFLVGATVGLLAHEGGHLIFDGIFDADPEFKRVEFHGIPFFAIRHKSGLSANQEFAISSAGFWVQNATNEWLLTRRPRLRSERAPFAKGVFAFNIGASVGYSIAAFATTGPDERDTRGMAVSSRIAEPWIGAIVLAPAVFDAWRYLDPDARWPIWASRAAKVGAVLLILR
jgi:hypothetical protein